ncbi:MAG TPA: hypothetical protein DEP05_06195, partial [Betaproteobacteria bacterium]|nr:hypothetical protein [Betaproteobacteria bacterium]
MIRRTFFIVVASISMLLCLTGTVMADSVAYPMATDNKLVVFRYDPNQSYTILTLPETVTDIQIGGDEHLTAPPAIGDSVEWVVEPVGRNVFVKPTRNGIFTSMTLVTNKRSYQITLRSSPKGGKWYQRVTWNYPDVVIADFDAAKAEAVRRKAAERRRVGIAPAADADCLSCNFDYSVAGSGSIKPAVVYDNGKVTFIRFPKKAQELPVVFVDDGGKKELVNYNYDPHDSCIVVQRVVRKLILTDGDAEVMLTNRKMAGKSDSSRLFPA